MNSESTTLPVSGRDVQFLAGLFALYTTIHSDTATEAEISHNLDSQKELLAHYYSATEAHALFDRLIARLPSDSPLTLVRDEAIFVDSHTTLVS